MKKLLNHPLTYLLLIFTFFVFWILWLLGIFPQGRVGQRQDEIGYTDVVETMVWRNGQLLEMWIDPIDSIKKHPDLLERRYDEAQRLLDNVNKMK